LAQKGASLKLGEIYRFFVQEGIKADPRDRSCIKTRLSAVKKEYNKLKNQEKKFFDKERLSNPYSDTRILYGKEVHDVKRLLIGIDITPGELLLADQLRQKGRNIDLVLSHHPSGVALAGLDDVMNLQTDLLCKLGIEKKIASDFMTRRIQEVSR